MAHVDGLGSGSRPKRAVLGVDQGPSGQSWEQVRAHVGGLGLSWGQSGRSWKGIRPESGPFSSGSRIQDRSCPPDVPDITDITRSRTLFFL